MRSTEKIEEKKINYTIEEIYFRDVLEAELNAQEMSDADFRRLVKNLKRDGALTSCPLLMRNEEGKLICISGHHRIKAALKADIEKGFCIVTGPLDESTRIRLQLSHNDIHGNPNDDIVAILTQKMEEFDISLIDTSNIEIEVKDSIEIKVDPPKFQYINICLMEESRDALVSLIMGMENSEQEKWILEKEQYDDVKDLLTYAFEKGFKTPGQAFGKFLEIVQQNLDQVKREKKKKTEEELETA